jgi:uncharacterized SAM-binding protein YcdF (DUF218 family)
MLTVVTFILQFLFNLPLVKYLRNTGKYSFIFLLLMLPVMLTGIYSFKIIPSKAFIKAQLEAPYDVIIVPGVPFHGDTMSTIMKARVLWACYLYKQGMTKNIIFSGAAVYTPYVEAKVMARYAMAMGIPEKNIFTDPVAEHSTENIYYSYIVARAMGFKKIALATDPVQSLLIRSFAKSKGIHVASVPIVFDILRTLDQTQPEINTEGLKADNFTPLPERENLWQRLKGTMGLRVDEKEAVLPLESSIAR